MKTAKILFFTVFALSLSFAGNCDTPGFSGAQAQTAAKPIRLHTVHQPVSQTINPGECANFSVAEIVSKTDRPSSAVRQLKPPSPTDEGFPKKPAPVFSNLSLSAPAGQGQYVQNGNVLTFKGAAIPHARLTSAFLEDDQNYVIRDVSKGVTMDPETGDLSGSFFVGSFRRALSVRLSIKIYDPLSKKTVKGTTNTLSVDNSYPKITVTEPMNHSYFKTAPIKISGTATDQISGVAGIEISVDGGASYSRVDFFSNGQWQYLFTPKNTQFLYSIKARTTDRVGHCSVSDNLVIHCNLPRTEKKITEQQKISTVRYHEKNADKLPDEDGICTYRIINLTNNRFQPSDLFTLKEEMAIIVKGYGGKMVTIKIIDPTGGKVVFELSDYIPVNKNKMWKWRLSKTGIFQAELLVDGSQKDDVFFKIIQ